MHHPSVNKAWYITVGVDKAWCITVGVDKAWCITIGVDKAWCITLGVDTTKCMNNHREHCAALGGFRGAGRSWDTRKSKINFCLLLKDKGSWWENKFNRISHFRPSVRLTCLDCHKCRLCKRRKKSWQEYELHCPLVMSERRSTTEGWIRKTMQKGRFGRSLKIRSNHFADFLWIREEAILQIILLFLSQHQILSFFSVHYS